MLALNPDDRIEIALAEGDGAPTLVFTYLTRKQKKEILSILSSAEELLNTDEDKAIGQYEDAIRVGLVGWRNLPTDYDPMALEQLFSDSEIQAIAVRYYREVSYLDWSKKKPFASPSYATTAKSAATATPEGASPEKTPSA